MDSGDTVCGKLAVTLGGASTDNDHFQLAGSCVAPAAPLDPGKSCTLQVTFQPPAKGASAVNLKATIAPEHGDPYDIAGSGYCS
jgi:hypothetical protein